MNFVYNCNGSTCAIQGWTRADATARVIRVMQAAYPWRVPRVTYLGACHPALTASVIVAKPKTPAEFRAIRDMAHAMVGAA